jgi:transcriptional regulator of arginine metabolism
VKNVSKQKRHYEITDILLNHIVTGQPQLVDLLEARGISVTQATISRDLVELGVIRVRIPNVDGQVYALPELPKDRIAPLDHLRRVLGEWVIDIDISGNLIVVRTPPGSAHVVASALDRSNLANVIGTVAGDDTVLIVTKDLEGGVKVAKQLHELARME